MTGLVGKQRLIPYLFTLNENQKFAFLPEVIELHVFQFSFAQQHTHSAPRIQCIKYVSKKGKCAILKQISAQYLP